CGLKNLILGEQLCDHIYCHRCGKAGGDSSSQEELCGYCNSPVDFKMIKSHYDNCDMYPINCNFCNRKFIRWTMKIHMLECARNLRKCKFWPMGCQFQGTRFEIERHESDHNAHIELIMSLLMNLQTEQSRNASMLLRSFDEHLSLRDVVSSSQCKWNELAEIKSSAAVKCDCVDLENNENYMKMKEMQEKQEMEINSCKQQLNDLELKYTNMIGELVSQNTQTEPNSGSVNEANEELNNKITEFEKCLADQNVILKTLTEQQTEQSDKVEKYEATVTAMKTANDKLTKSVAEDKIVIRAALGLDGNETPGDKIEKICKKQNYLESKLTSFEYIWKVEKFTEVQAKASYPSAVYSDPFYTSQFGYKMQFELYPNGQ
uniref:TRAF-type domain-containing protein n=1 Tax=Strigamia maritima TaxID=126957 RepID=T1JJ23_STRMM